MSFTNADAGNNLETNEAVVNYFIGLCKGTNDSLSSEFAITWKAAEE